MKAVKFTFDTHFGAAAAMARGAEKRSRKSYSGDEIDAMCSAAREEGAARAQAAIAGSVGQLAAALFDAIRFMDGEVETIRAQCVELAFVAARKLAGAALEAAPQEVVFETLREALGQAIGEPRILFKVAPALALEIEQRVLEIAAEEGYEGRVAIAADPSLAHADCRLEWRGGGTEHAAKSIETAMAELIARRFSPVDKNRDGE